jgi:DNA-binding transcriptional MocR family regulator
VEGLSVHRYGGEGGSGLVLGYGYLAEPALRRGVELLAAAAARP